MWATIRRKVATGSSSASHAVQGTRAASSRRYATKAKQLWTIRMLQCAASLFNLNLRQYFLEEDQILLAVLVTKVAWVVQLMSNI